MKMKRRDINDKLTEDIYKMNGINQLNQQLQEKFKLYDHSTSVDKLSNYFSWKEFCEIFTKTTLLWLFNYCNVEYALTHEKKFSYFYTEGNKYKSYFCLTCKKPEDVLENAYIEGKHIHEIWDQI